MKKSSSMKARTMKKSNLTIGMLYLAAGLACLCIAATSEGKIGGVLWGLAGAGLGLGVATVGQYVYWCSAKNKARYQQRLENETIGRHDELKEKLRDKTGRYAYVLGVIPDATAILFYLGSYLAFQVAAAVVIFNHLLQKY